MSESDPMWTTGRVCLWPNALFTGDHFEWRVPIDDENTLSVTWAFTRVPKEREPYVQGKIPAWYGPVQDAENGALDLEPHHEPGFRGVGGSRRRRRPDQGAPGLERSRHYPAAAAIPERSGSHREG